MKPILFNTEMVQAILDGRKTCTRRVVKPQIPDNVVKICDLDPLGYITLQTTNQYLDGWENRKSQYAVGDILYVRETFCYDDFDNGGETIYFKADYNEREIKYLFTDCDMKWHPSLHMPKEAARIFLKVTEVRAERLQDITDSGAKMEGITAETNNSGVMHLAKFQILWNSIIKKQDLDRYGWDANSYVWVYEFERCEKP